MASSACGRDCGKGRRDPPVTSGGSIPPSSTTLTMAYLPSRVALPDLTPPNNRPSHYYSESSCRQAIRAHIRVGVRPLEALDGGVAVRDGDYGQLGQCALPEDGSGMTVQPSWLE